MERAKSKFISLLLIAVMLVNALPSTVATAVSPETDAPAIQSVTTVPNQDYVEGGTVRELESRREENVKHFLLPDNTVQAVVYADAVHRKDDGGHWQDISNDLTLTEVKGVKFYATADERVVFAEKFAPNAQLWQLSENGYSIAMGMSRLQLSADATVTPVGGVTVTNAPQRRSATVWHSVEEARAVDNTASIVYSNVRSNTDLEYVMTGNDIKENIVVKSKANSYSYPFELTLTGLSAVLNEDGSISLADSSTGQQQYSIPAPYMVDAAGEYSDAVTYTLKKTGAGAYTLTVTADSSWINAEGRAFPVKIDPTVVRVDATDTYINSRYPDKNYGSAEKLWIFDGTAALFKMSLPSLPATADISSVVLNVSYFYNNSVTSGMIYAAAYQVLQPWNESTLTWNTASQNTNQGISTSLVTVDMLFGDVNAYQDSPGWAQFNITPIAESWYNGTPNYGVAIKYFDGTNSSVILNSYETGAAYRPYYVITYSEARIADGVYMLQNMGTNLYMDVRNGGYTAGTAVQQNTVTNSANMRNQLFKITFLDSQGYYNYYSIRPMTNSGMGLYAPLTGDTRNVSIQLMSYAENFSSISAERRWVISPEGSYFTIRNGSGSQGGYLASMYNAGVQMQTVSSVSSYSTWRLIPYTGNHMQGAFLTDPSPEVVVGSSINLDAVVYSTRPGVNGPPSFSVYDADMTPTDKAIIEPTTGTLVASKVGTVKIGVTVEGTSDQWLFVVTIIYAYELDVAHYYDIGYNVRFGNAGTDIQSYQSVCADIFGELFYLDVNTTIQGYTSCADDCKATVAPNNLTMPCIHSPGHLNYQDIRNDGIGQYGNGSDILSRVFWSGHLLNNNPSSNSQSSTHTIVMTILHTTDANHINKSNEKIRYQSIFTLLHETSHQIGAPDHYCYGDDTNNASNPCGNLNCYKCVYLQAAPPQCVMTWRYYDLEDRLNNGTLQGVYCAECMGTGANSIFAHLADHH